MSDFLGNLIARAAQRTPVLERRRRALFEPAVPWIGPFTAMIDRAVDPSVQASPFASSQPSRVSEGNAPGQEPYADASVVQGVSLLRIAERKDSELSPRPAALRDTRTDDRRGHRLAASEIDVRSAQSSMSGTASIATQTRPTDLPENRPPPRAERSRTEGQQTHSPTAQAREARDRDNKLLAPAAPRITQ